MDGESDRGHGIVPASSKNDLPEGKDAAIDQDVLHAVLDKGQPVFLADRFRRVVYMNAPFQEIAPHLFPEFRSAERLNRPMTPAPRALENVFDRLNDGAEQVEIQHQIETTGGPRSFRSVHFRCYGDGAPAGYAGIYCDVTRENAAIAESDLAAARLEDFIRSASDWVWETDANLNLTYVSNRVGDYFNAPPSRLIGRYLFSLGILEDSERKLAEIQKFTESLMPFRDLILTLGRSGENRFRIALSGVPYFNEDDGTLAGYRGIGRDITRERYAERQAKISQGALLDSMRELQERNVELAQALEKAKIASQAKTDFLGKMSHELRTPLNAIIGFSDLSLQEAFGKVPGRYKEYFKDINQAANHLLNIINDILDAANMDAGQSNVRIEDVSLKPLVHEVVPLVENDAGTRGIDITAVSVDDGWTVRADRVRLRQILINLIVNALKFTERGGSVGIETKPGPGGSVEITVWDTGVGIPREQQDSIFEGFHQIRADPFQGPAEGIGLGLTISRQLARRMEGDIRVSSKPGEGSRFTVVLPKAPAKKKKAKGKKQKRK